jgi:phosphoglycolate phosphatase
MYDAILFDLDGTLIDSAEDLVQAVQHAFVRLGVEAPDRSIIIRNVGRPLVDFPELLGRDFTDRQRRDFVRYYRAYYSLHCGDHTTCFPGVIVTLERLRSAGLKLAVITTKSQDQAEGTVRTVGLSRFFGYVRGMSDGRKPKPDPEPLLETIKELGVQPIDVLMVGDSEQDILAAQGAGVDSCACLYGFRDPDYLLSLEPTYHINSFSELLGIALVQDWKLTADNGRNHR